MLGMFNAETRGQTAGRFQLPRFRQILPWVAVVLIAIAAGAALAMGPAMIRNIRIPSFGNTANTNPVHAIPQKPVAQPFDTTQGKPAQQVPEAVAPVKIHVEWTKIGTARNGNEVVALGIPWDNLIRVPVELVDNLPPSVTGIAGGILTGRETVILVTYAETQPWVLTYWQSTEIPCATIKGLCP